MTFNYIIFCFVWQGQNINPLVNKVVFHDTKKFHKLNIPILYKFQWILWWFGSKSERILRMSQSWGSSRPYQMLWDRKLLQTWTHRLSFGSGFENSNDHFPMRDCILCLYWCCYNYLLFCSPMSLVRHLFRILGQRPKQYR